MKITHRGPALARAAFWLTCVLLAPALLAADDSLRLETLLILGTNDPQAPDPKQIPVDAALAKKLGTSPYRWKNYFQINRQVVEIPLNATKEKIAISKVCSLDIKNIGDSHIDVTIYGKGKSVATNRKESVPKDGIFILGGESSNDTAWLVVIRQTVSPVTKEDGSAAKTDAPAPKPAPAPATNSAPTPVPTPPPVPATNAPPPAPK